MLMRVQPLVIVTLGEFFISGTLDMVAQPMLGLSGDFFIKLDAPWWSPLSDKTWTWPIGSKEWPLSDPIGLSAEVKEYVLGSGKVPEVEFKKPEFDGSKFMTNMVDKKLPEKSGGAKEGGGTFKEDGSVPKPPADVPAPKKGAGDKDKGKGKPDAKGGKKPPLDPAKGKKDDKGKQKDLEMLQNAGKDLEAIKGTSLTRAELDKKINGIKNKAKDVTFNVVAQGDKWAITPSCNGQTGKVIRIAANLKPEDKKKEEDKKDGKKDDINSALAEIHAEGKQKIADGEVTQKDAEQIAADVKRDHPTVINSISVKETDKTWNFEYIQRTKGPSIPKSSDAKKNVVKLDFKSGESVVIFTKITNNWEAANYNSYDEKDDLYSFKIITGRKTKGSVISFRSDLLNSNTLQRIDSTLAKGKGEYYPELISQDPEDVGPFKHFSTSQKATIIAKNIAKNGQLMSDSKSPKVLLPATRREKGVPVNTDEVQIDHVFPRSKGGWNSYANAQILSMSENIKKSNKVS